MGSPGGTSRYNVQVINALVLYSGMQAIQQMHNKPNSSTSSITTSPTMDIYRQMIAELDSEGNK